MQGGFVISVKVKLICTCPFALLASVYQGCLPPGHKMAAPDPGITSSPRKTGSHRLFSLLAFSSLPSPHLTPCLSQKGKSVLESPQQDQTMTFGQNWIMSPPLPTHFWKVSTSLFPKTSESIVNQNRASHPRTASCEVTWLPHCQAGAHIAQPGLT